MPTESSPDPQRDSDRHFQDNVRYPEYSEQLAILSSLHSIRFVPLALGCVGNSVFGKIFADELADDLRGRQILLRAQCLERFLLVGINQQSEASGFRFHRLIIS
jgi:hypothetical protein